MALSLWEITTTLFFFFFLKRKHISLKQTRRVIQRACEAGQRKQFTAQIRMQKRQYKGRGNALPNLGRKSNKLNYKKIKANLEKDPQVHLLNQIPSSHRHQPQQAQHYQTRPHQLGVSYCSPISTWRGSRSLKR